MWLELYRPMADRNKILPIPIDNFDNKKQEKKLFSVIKLVSSLSFRANFLSMSDDSQNPWSAQIQPIVGWPRKTYQMAHEYSSQIFMDEFTIHPKKLKNSWMAHISFDPKKGMSFRTTQPAPTHYKGLLASDSQTTQQPSNLRPEYTLIQVRGLIVDFPMANLLNRLLMGYKKKGKPHQVYTLFFLDLRLLRELLLT